MQLGHAAPSRNAGGGECSGRDGLLGEIWDRKEKEINGTDLDPKSSVELTESLLRPASPAGQNNRTRLH